MSYTKLNEQKKNQPNVKPTDLIESDIFDDDRNTVFGTYRPTKNVSRSTMIETVVCSTNPKLVKTFVKSSLNNLPNKLGKPKRTVLLKRVGRPKSTNLPPKPVARSEQQINSTKLGRPKKADSNKIGSTKSVAKNNSITKSYLTKSTKLDVVLTKRGRGRPRKLEDYEVGSKSYLTKSNSTKFDKPKSKRGRKPNHLTIAKQKAKEELINYDQTDEEDEIAEEDLDELINESNSLDDEVFENTPSQEKFKVNISGEKGACDCPPINLQSFNMFVSNPNIRDQRSLDEFAINLRILQRSKEFLIFNFNETIFKGDDCKIFLERIDYEAFCDQSKKMVDQVQDTNHQMDYEQTNNEVDENNNKQIQNSADTEDAEQDEKIKSDDPKDKCCSSLLSVEEQIQNDDLKENGDQ